MKRYYLFKLYQWRDSHLNLNQKKQTDEKKYKKKKKPERTENEKGQNLFAMQLNALQCCVCIYLKSFLLTPMAHISGFDTNSSAQC